MISLLTLYRRRLTSVEWRHLLCAYWFQYHLGFPHVEVIKFVSVSLALVLLCKVLKLPWNFYGFHPIFGISHSKYLQIFWGIQIIRIYENGMNVWCNCLRNIEFVGCWAWLWDLIYHLRRELDFIPHIFQEKLPSDGKVVCVTGKWLQFQCPSIIGTVLKEWDTRT